MATSPQRPEIQRIEQEYRRNVAVLEARPKLEQGLLFVWLLVDVALIAYFLLSVVLYLVSGTFTEVRSVATIAQNAGDLHDAAAARVAVPLEEGDVHVLSHAASSYDLYATVENANADWYATVEYTFTGGDLALPTRTAVVMPGETQYLLALGVDAASRPTGAKLNVSSLTWTRVDRHDVPDTAAFLAERSNFALSDSAYAADVALEKDTVGRSTFQLTNNTSYGYYDPTFVVLLKRGGTIAAVNTVTVPRFKAGETREVEVHWFGVVPTSGSVEAIADVDFFDEDSYMDPQGAVQEDVRDRVTED